MRIKKKIIVNCDFCKNPFEIYPYQLKVDKLRFCNRKCKGKYWSLIIVKENHPNFKGGLPKCVDCGKELSCYIAKRCKKCNDINRSGVKSVFYKEERHKICKCGIKLSSVTKGDKCRKCYDEFNIGLNHFNFGVKINGQRRKILSLAHGGTGIPYELTEYGSEFDSSLKERVRFRDGYKCKICGCSQLENCRQLSIHHIDYNKKNNNINNLVSLCLSCHMRTNYNRNYWKNQILGQIALLNELIKKEETPEIKKEEIK